LLFRNQDLSRDDLLHNAMALKLDERRFTSCVDSGQYKGEIDNDLKEGIRAGVSGTPSFFINGVFISGAQPIAVFDKIIKEEIVSIGQEQAPNQRGLRAPPGLPVK
jgi:protein-disulfide isomerase